MKCLGVVLLYVIFNNFLIFGQFNLQTGYDFGLITKQKNRHSHRLSLITEYIFGNNMMISLSLGKDYFYRNSEGSSTNSVLFGTYCEKRTSTYKVNYSANNIGLSLGYQFQLTDNSGLITKLSAEGYFYNGVRIKESIQTSMRYNSDCNEISSSPEVITTSIIDNSSSYNNRFGNKGNRKFIFPILVFSVEYRIKLDPIDLNLHFGASPERNNLYKNDRVIRGNYLFFGLRLGYTLPQKNKNDEK